MGDLGIAAAAIFAYRRGLPNPPEAAVPPIAAGALGGVIAAGGAGGSDSGSDDEDEEEEERFHRITREYPPQYDKVTGIVWFWIKNLLTHCDCKERFRHTSIRAFGDRETWNLAFQDPCDYEQMRNLVRWILKFANFIFELALTFACATQELRFWCVSSPDGSGRTVAMSQGFFYVIYPGQEPHRTNPFAASSPEEAAYQSFALMLGAMQVAQLFVLFLGFLVDAAEQTPKANDRLGLRFLRATGRQAPEEWTEFENAYRVHFRYRARLIRWQGICISVNILVMCLISQCTLEGNTGFVIAKTVSSGFYLLLILWDVWERGLFGPVCCTSLHVHNENRPNGNSLGTYVVRRRRKHQKYWHQHARRLNREGNPVGIPEHPPVDRVIQRMFGNYRGSAVA